MPAEGEKISEIDRKKMKEDPTRAYWYTPEQKEKRAQRRDRSQLGSSEIQKKTYFQWRKGKGTL